MVRNILLKILLLPVSLVYGFFSILFNALYDFSFLNATPFSMPVINVGNLTVGGSGKTPHTEYLIQLLKPYINVAVLSRGYKRKTKGFKIVTLQDNVHSVGDEPLLYKRKYSDIGVYVHESRSEGIPALLMKKPQTQVILLDDAYQHRAVKPSLNILLTEYDKPFSEDFFLPSGRLREWRSAYKRADIIIVSKCPEKLNKPDKQKLLEKINPLSHQKIYFSYYSYYKPYYIYNASYTIQLDDSFHVLLISAIASSSYLLQYLHEKLDKLDVIEFVDHHNFSEYDISQIKTHFDLIETKKKIILTTEKDATRLDIHRKFFIDNKLPVYILPVGVKFHFSEEKLFEDHIKNHLLEFKV